MPPVIPGFNEEDSDHVHRMVQYNLSWEKNGRMIRTHPKDIVRSLYKKVTEEWASRPIHPDWTGNLQEMLSRRAELERIVLTKVPADTLEGFVLPDLLGNLSDNSPSVKSELQLLLQWSCSLRVNVLI